MMIQCAALVILIALPSPFDTGKRRIDDPIYKLYQQHMQEADAVRNDLSIDRRAYLEAWLSQFSVALVNHPTSPYVSLAKSQMLGILNSLGRRTESVELLESMLDEARDDRQRAWCLHQMGLAAYGAAIVEKSPAYAEKAIDSFAKMREVEGHPNINWVTGFSKCGFIASTVLNDHARAAKFYNEGYLTLGRLSERQLAQVNNPNAVFVTEQILINAAVEYARTEQPGKAIDSMDKLAQIEGRQFPMTEHFVRLLSDARESPSLSLYCDRAAKWLSKNTDDKDVPRLAGQLGLAYETAGKYEQAETWLSVALDYADDPAFSKARHVDRKYLATSIAHVRYEIAGKNQRR